MKKIRTPKTINNIATDDRLSSLTDELLHQILYFLDTKDAVQTCVLSKRWVSLWKSLPYLNFNFRDYVDSSDELLYHVLIRRHPVNVVEVRLNCPDPDFAINSMLAQSLICYAVQWKVEKLDICFSSDSDIDDDSDVDDIVWPESFYTCQSLTVLRLENHRHWQPNNSIQLPKQLALPALKSLHLVGFAMKEERFDPSRVFSNCPNLETLKLDRVLFVDLKILRIHALNLRSLKISQSKEWRRNKLRLYNLEIHAPKLTTFKYSGFANIACTMMNLIDSIDNVYFKIRKHPTGLGEENLAHLIDTFMEFRHAKSLTLTLKTLKVLSPFPALLGDQIKLSFANLKRLNLKVGSLKKCERFLIPAWLMNFFVNSSTLVKICP